MKNLFVALGIKDKYFTVLSRPTRKKECWLFKDCTLAGEQFDVMPVNKLLNLSGVEIIGEQYLKI